MMEDRFSMEEPMVQTQIFLPYAMPGCMRRVVGHFRRYRLGSDLVPVNASREHALFNGIQWMEMGSHALEIPQYVCIGMRNARIVSERLHEHYGIDREIAISPKQFCAVTMGRFRMATGKPLMDAKFLLVEGSDPVVFRSEYTPDPIVMAECGRSTLYVTRLPQEQSELPLLDWIMKIETKLRASKATSAVIPRIHLSRWDVYPSYLGLTIKGKEDWTLGYAEAHTILTVEPVGCDVVAKPPHVTEIRPPLLVWIRREGDHFEFPTLVGVMAAEDFA